MTLVYFIVNKKGKKIVLLFAARLLGGSKSYLETVTEFLYIFSSVSSRKCCLMSPHKMIGSIRDLDSSLNVWFRPLTHLVTNTQQFSWLRALLCRQGEAAQCGPACCSHYSTELTVHWVLPALPARHNLTFLHEGRFQESLPKWSFDMVMPRRWAFLCQTQGAMQTC